MGGLGGGWEGKVFNRMQLFHKVMVLVMMVVVVVVVMVVVVVVVVVSTTTLLRRFLSRGTCFV